MTDNMDVNAGAIADGEATVQEVGREIFDSCWRSRRGAGRARRSWGTRSSCRGGSGR